MLVVGYNDHSSLVVVQGDDKGVDGIDIEMVGRFVQHQNVRVSPNHHSECDSGFLTSGKQVLWSQGQIARDSERPEVITIGFLGLSWEVLHKLFQRGKHQLQLIDVMLSEHLHDKPSVTILVAFLELKVAYQQLEKCTLTGPVGAYDSHACLHIDCQVHVTQNGTFRFIIEVTVLDLQKRWSQFVWSGEYEDTGRILNYFLNQFHLFHGLDTRLHQRGSLGVISEPVDECLHVSKLQLLAFMLFLEH